MLIAKLVSQGYGVQVADAAVGAKGGEGFIFRPAVERLHLLVPVFRFHDPLATDDAGVAGVSFQDSFRHRLARDRFGLTEHAAGVVAGR